jgi:hypothetical protein
MPRERCRDVLLELADHPIGKPIGQALLAEVIALRTIVANLIYSFTSEGKVTREQSSEVLQSRGCEHQFREACTGFPRDGKARGCQGVS